MKRIITKTADTPTDQRRSKRMVTIMVEDETLYCHFLNGDKNALRELIERYGNSLTFYINGYTHDVNEAEDLMLEAFARIVAKNPRFSERGFKTYLYKTGRNLALRFIAKRSRLCSFSLENLDCEPMSTELLEDILQTKERNNILHLSMQKIQPDYREVLYLLYFDGLRYKEAAEVMNKSEKQIANLVYRGKQALRPILEKEGMSNAQY
ncbi:MAG: RNA polymerase sigma factor [Oscillospiraceae bacterium]